MPQTYNLYCFIIWILVKSLLAGKTYTKIKGINRIGPHNIDIMSIIYGSLLGDAHAEKRIFGIGTRISFYQEDTHLNYIYYLHSMLSTAGYCNNSVPLTKNRLGVKGKVRKVIRFHT